MQPNLPRTKNIFSIVLPLFDQASLSKRPSFQAKLAVFFYFPPVKYMVKMSHRVGLPKNINNFAKTHKLFF